MHEPALIIGARRSLIDIINYARACRHLENIGKQEND